jgi:hypothetical protein
MPSSAVRRIVLGEVADIDETFAMDPAEVEKCMTPNIRGTVMAKMS